MGAAEASSEERSGSRRGLRGYRRWIVQALALAAAALIGVAVHWAISPDALARLRYRIRFGEKTLDLVEHRCVFGSLYHHLARGTRHPWCEYRTVLLPSGRVALGAGDIELIEFVRFYARRTGATMLLDPDRTHASIVVERDVLDIGPDEVKTLLLSHGVELVDLIDGSGARLVQVLVSEALLRTPVDAPGYPLAH